MGNNNYDSRVRSKDILRNRAEPVLFLLRFIFET